MKDFKADTIAACESEAEACGSALIILRRIADRVAEQVATVEGDEFLGALAVARKCVAQSAGNWRDIARALKGDVDDSVPGGIPHAES